MLVFDAPAHVESFLRDVHDQVREMPRDLGAMLEIGKRHQVEFALSWAPCMKGPTPCRLTINRWK